MRRRVAVGAAGFAVLTAGVLFAHWFATRPTHNINEATIGQITEGMTLAEVEAIFGVPPGDYSTRSVDYTTTCSRIGWHSSLTWKSNEAILSVDFDDKQRVERLICYTAREEAWRHKVCRWLRLLSTLQ